MKTEQITAKVRFGGRDGVEVECPPRQVELPTEVEELLDLDPRAAYGVNSSVVELFNSALTIRLQAQMRAEAEKSILAEFLASKK
jgi:hypothetical protein